MVKSYIDEYAMDNWLRDIFWYFDVQDNLILPGIPVPVSTKRAAVESLSYIRPAYRNLLI